MKRIVLLAAPLLFSPGAALLYTDVNIHRRWFVDHLGCGCGPFPNTNHLTLAFYLYLVAGAFAFGWLVSRGVCRHWRIAYLSIVALSGLACFKVFMHYNLWA